MKQWRSLRILNRKWRILARMLSRSNTMLKSGIMDCFFGMADPNFCSLCSIWVKSMLMSVYGLLLIVILLRLSARNTLVAIIEIYYSFCPPTVGSTLHLEPNLKIQSKYPRSWTQSIIIFQATPAQTPSFWHPNQTPSANIWKTTCSSPLSRQRTKHSKATWDAWLLVNT